MPDRDVSDGNNNYSRTAQINDRAIMYTVKMDHRFSERISLSGFYLYNKTTEPCADFWEPGLTLIAPSRFADPGDYILERRVDVLALNNTWLPSNNTVVTLRYGFTRFITAFASSISMGCANRTTASRSDSTAPSRRQGRSAT